MESFAQHDESFVASQIFVALNSIAHLSFVWIYLPVRELTEDNWDTHVVSKLFSGLSILNILHNGAVAFQWYTYNSGRVFIPASVLIKLATGITFGAACVLNDGILGGALGYILLALAVQQSGNWAKLLGAWALGSAVVIGYRNWPRKQGAVQLPTKLEAPLLPL